MKLVIEEPESSALASHLTNGQLIATSRIALVEVARATAIANPADEVQTEASRLLSSCLLVNVDDSVLRAAAELASETLRTLDAIHLASALWVEPDELIAYDRRLLEAARERGLAVSHPAPV